MQEDLADREGSMPAADDIPRIHDVHNGDDASVAVCVASHILSRGQVFLPAPHLVSGDVKT